MPVLDRARTDLAAGRPWAARDRLRSALVDRADEEVVALLADVQACLGDLPAAGALWFALGRTGPTVAPAVAAWRSALQDDPRRLWLSLPRGLRDPDRPAVRPLWEQAGRPPVRRAVRDGGDAAARPTGDDGGWWWPVVAAALVAAGLAVFVVGVVTVLGWVL